MVADRNWADPDAILAEGEYAERKVAHGAITR